MKTYIKKSLQIILTLTLILSFAACSKGFDDAETAVSVGNATVGSDVYAYFLDGILQGDNASLKESDARALAEEKAAYYIKVNTEFETRGLSLASSDKADLASEVNNLWNIYGGYYTKIGVTKSTLTKVKESESYELALVNSIYGTGGDKVISEDARKAYFSENYVFFKAINAYLCTTNDAGETVPLSESELTAIKTKFAEMKASISGENTIDAVNLAYVEANGGSTESEMPVLSTTSTSESYPKGFFSDVAAMENDAISVLTYDNYIFVVQKKDGSSLYADYSAAVLKSMVADEFSEYIASAYKDAKTTGENDVEKNCFNLILNTRKR